MKAGPSKVQSRLKQRERISYSRNTRMQQAVWLWEFSARWGTRTPKVKYGEKLEEGHRDAYHR